MTSALGPQLPSTDDGRPAVRRRTLAIALVVVLAVIAPWLLPAACTARPSADSTEQLQAQLDSLKPGGSLRLNPQVYEHRGVITIRVPNVHIDGGGATLRATNDETSAVQILANGVALSNVTLAANEQGERYSGKDQHKLVISAAGVDVSHVTITGSAAAGSSSTGPVTFASTMSTSQVVGPTGFISRAAAMAVSYRTFRPPRPVTTVSQWCRIRVTAERAAIYRSPA